MSTAPEDFEKLRKLLKLKRHEQPPPGYFNNFSRQVIGRIEAEGRSSRVDVLSAEAPWAKKLVWMLETNPIFAGAFGVSICALLIFGITSFQYVDRTSVAVMSENANAASPTLLSKSSSDAFSPSINPMFSTNIPGASSLGVLSLSAQPNSIEPVMFSPEH
jgi:hypothetical protein